MTPQDIVNQFIELTARCLDVLVANYEGVQRTADQPLALLPRGEGIAVRSGELPGLGYFELHGRGCRFELASGADLDVDWDADGRAIFDSWRILMFARSIGDDAIDQASLGLAADASPELWRVRDDWFTWADRNYDLTWSSA